MLVNDEARALKRMHHELHDSRSDGLATSNRGNEVQRQQIHMTTIVANKIRVAFDRLAALSKHRDLLIANLQHKLHSIEEVESNSTYFQPT